MSDLAMRNRLLYAIRWAHERRKTLNAWVVRAVSFYFGYRILHHEIYEKATAEPLLVFLGLWLCGIAPASFFDGVRRVTETIGPSAPSDTKPELESKEKPRR